jgi:hypothetical protein
MNTRTRLKTTLATALFMAGIILLATLLHLEVIASAAIASLMTILSAYLWAETKRPSIPKNKVNHGD